LEEVGAISAGCLANDGHTIFGFDTNETKVDLINGRPTPVTEKVICELIAQAFKMANCERLFRHKKRWKRDVAGLHGKTESLKPCL
jgi:UDP-glucose 6-dehydrogenase